MELNVTRTIVKSEPELRELVEADPRLQAPGVRVSLVEGGFGTRVAISALYGAGLGTRDLERILDELGAPTKRPFTAV
jgi:hypothetical protein